MEWKLTYEMQKGHFKLGETYLQKRKEIELVYENGINGKNFSHKPKLQNNLSTTIVIPETNFSNYTEFIEFWPQAQA